jgi:chitin synthase
MTMLLTNLKGFEFRLKLQKYCIVSSIAVINSILISTLIFYKDYWYAFLLFLLPASLLNAFSSLLNIFYKMCCQSSTGNTHRLDNKNYIYVVPCYNESADELLASIHSLMEQRIVKKDNRLILIICDGKVKGAGNTLSTDAILKELLKTEGMGYYYEYPTWDGTNNIICEYKVMYTYNRETVPIILLIKERNYGKRDSLVIARRICLAFNKYVVCQDNVHDGENHAFLINIVATFANVFTQPIDYIIGIDGDTVFDYNCTYELIQGIEQDSTIHGCVGFVDVDSHMKPYSPFVLYQYAEYVYAQCLRRQAQSNITHKVSCLSGCNQILRVSEETCGEKILQVFNYKPKETDHILTHIRSYASEDRNHVCNMLSLYPHVKTTQALKAVAYTVVPTTITVFLSQRRRWNLGANTNDLLLIYLPDINICERILAFVNVVTFALSPFIYVATIYFFIAIFTEPTMLMLYLSIILFIPLFYTLLVPLFIKPMSFRESLYYYLAYIFFVSLSGCVSLICYVNAILNMDVLTWGKTRTIESLQEDEGVLREIILRLDATTDETATDNIINEKTTTVSQVVNFDSLPIVDNHDKLNMEWIHVDNVNVDNVNVDNVNIDNVNIDNVNIDNVNVESVNVEKNIDVNKKDLSHFAYYTWL